MAVKIRLSRVGKKHAPFFRLVVADGRNKRDGKFIENLGTYNPLKSEWVVFKPERFDHWVSQGAIPTNSAEKLYKQFKKASKAEAAA